MHEAETSTPPQTVEDDPPPRAPEMVAAPAAGREEEERRDLVTSSSPHHGRAPPSEKSDLWRFPNPKVSSSKMMAPSARQDPAPSMTANHASSPQP